MRIPKPGEIWLFEWSEEDPITREKIKTREIDKERPSVCISKVDYQHQVAMFCPISSSIDAQHNDYVTKLITKGYTTNYAYAHQIKSVNWLNRNYKTTNNKLIQKDLDNILQKLALFLNVRIY
jgi:hypothetical protein